MKGRRTAFCEPSGMVC